MAIYYSSLYLPNMDLGSLRDDYRHRHAGQWPADEALKAWVEQQVWKGVYERDALDVVVEHERECKEAAQRAAQARDASIATKMFLSGIKAQEAWMTGLSVVRTESGNKVVKKEPKVIYTIAKPGKCSQCGLMTVVTREGEDRCEACN